MGAAIEVFEGAEHDRGRPRPVPAGEDDQRPAGAARPTATGSTRATTSCSHDGVDAVPFVDLDSRTTSWSATSTRGSPTASPSLRRRRAARRRRGLDVRRRTSTVAGTRSRLERRRRAGSSRHGSTLRRARVVPMAFQPHADRPAEHRRRARRADPRVARAAAALRPAAARGARASRCARTSPRRWTCRPSTTRRWTATRSTSTTSPPPREDHPVHLPVVGEMAAGQTKLFALSPGHGGPDHDRRAGAAGRRRGRAGRVDRRRASPPCGSPRRRSSTQHVRHKGEDVQTGDVLLEDGTRPRPAPARPARLASGRSQVRSRPRPRVVIMSTGAELREPGTPLGHDSIYDANSYMLAAAAAVRRGDRLPGRHRLRRPARVRATR